MVVVPSPGLSPKVLRVTQGTYYYMDLVEMFEGLAYCYSRVADFPSM